ncbi:MAG: TonB-dependent receptor [Bacteroidota bacterium]
MDQLSTSLASTKALSLRTVKGLALLLLTVFFNQSFAQSQTGAVQGTVTTSDGKPAEFISVGLVGTSAGASTGLTGTFKINRVKPGTYTISATAVNIAKQQKEITVVAGQTATVNFVLDISNVKLQEVEVKDRANRLKIDNPSQSLRLQEPIIQVAQNIQVVSSKALADQQIISMSDGVIRNISGAVRLEHWGDLYANITMRGSQIQAFRNGFNVVSSFWGPLTEDMSIVDHIEFVKGPAGFMLGSGDPSGLYNVVTKKPTGQTKGEFGLTVGSFNLNRATLDLDGKLSKDGKLLYRLNLAAQNKGSFRPNEYNDRYTVAPVISYQIDDKSKITAEYVYQRAHTSDVGSYYVFAPKDKGYASLPRNFTQTSAGLPPTNINDHSFTLNFQHQISDNWKLTAQASRYSYSQLGTSQWVDSVNTDGTYYRNYGIWEAESRMSLAQVFLNGKVTTGKVVHKFLGGLDFGDKKYVADYAQTHSLDTGSRPFNPYDGGQSLDNPSNGFGSFDRSKSLEARAAAGFGLINSKYSSVYAQDELGFFDNRVRLTLAGRYTSLSTSDFGTSTDAKKFTPRVGLSVSVDNQTSVYGLYDQAFIPQVVGKLVDGGSIKPITGSNLEFGIKKDWSDGKWNTTLSVYRITKNNEAQADITSTPQNPVSFLLGQKRAQGLEFDLRGELAQGLNLTANYALTDSKVTQLGAHAGSAGIAVGDVVPGYAKHVANAWLTYKLSQGGLKGTGVSLGGTYYGGRQTDTWSVGLQKLPNYFKMDGGLFWEGSKLRVNANVFNVLDKYTYSGSYYSWINAYYWQADAPRNFRVSLTYRF